MVRHPGQTADPATEHSEALQRLEGVPREAPVQRPHPALDVLQQDQRKLQVTLPGGAEPGGGRQEPHQPGEGRLDQQDCWEAAVRAVLRQSTGRQRVLVPRGLAADPPGRVGHHRWPQSGRARGVHGADECGPRPDPGAERGRRHDGPVQDELPL
uniref:(northern house mosquito) hypothetical protein n=2 Tax=Culex pipiens TaxID=7175 RepID=A0A8D8JN98_CULPI